MKSPDPSLFGKLKTLCLLVFWPLLAFNWVRRSRERTYWFYLGTLGTLGTFFLGGIGVELGMLSLAHIRHSSYETFDLTILSIALSFYLILGLLAMTFHPNNANRTRSI